MVQLREFLKRHALIAGLILMVLFTWPIDLANSGVIPVQVPFAVQDVPSLNVIETLSVPLARPAEVALPAKSAVPDALLYVRVIGPENDPSEAIGNPPLTETLSSAMVPPFEHSPLKPNARFVSCPPCTSKRTNAPSVYVPA